MKKRITIVGLWLILFFINDSASAQESKFKALFIQKFIEYTNWPDDRNEVVIGVFGNSQVLLELEKSSNSKRRYTIVKIAGAGDIVKCDVIYLPEAQNRNFDLVLQATSNKSVLVITDNASFAEKGSCISFYLEDSKLKFIVNQMAMKKANLRVSSALLSLAKVI